MSVETVAAPTAPASTLPPGVEFDYSKFVVEDGKPLDGPYQYGQLRILPETLRMSWSGPGDNQPWLIYANVGVFHIKKQPAIVPDVLVAVGVEAPSDFTQPENNSYFIWDMGKPPDVVVEFVSATPGGEDTEKLKIYGTIGVPWYVIFDPYRRLSSESLRVFQRITDRLVPTDSRMFDYLNLGVSVWRGTYEGLTADWLRWTDGTGTLLPTKEEAVAVERERANLESGRAEQVTRQRDDARQQVEQERQRAEQERQRAEQERQRAERLAETLRKMGVNPEQV